MPEKIEVMVYKFEELVDDARERALEKVGGWNAEWENENMKYMFEQYLEERGLPAEKIEWSLGHSQGDGVAFYGDIDVEKCLRFMKKWNKYRHLYVRSDGPPYANIVGNSWSTHYSHYNTMDVHCEMSEALTEELEEFVRNVSGELEKIGYDAFEYAYSDEAVAETCEANEIRFDERGRIV